MYMNILKVMLSTLYVASASYYIYQKYYRKKKTHDEINEVFMFSDGVKVLTKSKHSRCMVTPSMDRLLYYLNSPRYSLDICMYVITNRDLASVIIKQHFRGIKVRVILDADMAFSNGSVFKKLENQGIEVRWMKSNNIMHHKFCLIDKLTIEILNSTPIVICGSLNWTNQALNGNWEDVLVTSQKELVEGYKVEFERLWDQFKSIV